MTNSRPAGRRRKIFAIGVLAATISLLATSCSSLTTSAETATRNPALSDAMANEAILGETPLTDDFGVATCIGDELYTEIGPVRLEALGITVEEPNIAASAELEDEVSAAIASCTAAEAAESTDSANGNQASATAQTEPTEPSDTAAPAPAAPEPDEPADAGPVEYERPEAVAALVDGAEITSDPATANCIVTGSMDQLGNIVVLANGMPRVATSEAPTMLAVMDDCLDVESLFVTALAAASNPVPIEVARCFPIELGTPTLRSWLADAMVGGDLDPLGDRAWTHIQTDGFVSCA